MDIYYLHGSTNCPAKMFASALHHFILEMLTTII